VALVFGREDRGLSNDELLQAGKILRLESSADYASLNLSHAVAICLHELRRIPASTAPPGIGSGVQGPDQAPLLAQAGALPCGDPDGGAWPAAAASLAASAGAGATSLRGALEATLADGQDLLLEVGFLHPHTAHARMAKLRGLLQRAQIREGEVALIRGMVRQLRWATTRRTP
jgi:tRNA/rRNA methyltransferase